jgi:hypothetical protein
VVLRLLVRSLWICAHLLTSSALCTNSSHSLDLPSRPAAMPHGWSFLWRATAALRAVPVTATLTATSARAMVHLALRHGLPWLGLRLLIVWVHCWSK